ncbi:hypothetical protein WJX84_006080 [Apatococcus fuscideae]|uniref:LPXTG cell wall anchor domain-containing protein n=1 Tax=Apatococcus fuscideae TaxID=2026836 RepID=A0AAW1TE33_9CHLO
MRTPFTLLSSNASAPAPFGDIETALSPESAEPPASSAEVPKPVAAPATSTVKTPAEAPTPGEAEGEAASALTPAAEVPEAPLEAQAGADTKDILQEPPPSLPSPPPVAPASSSPSTTAYDAQIDEAAGKGAPARQQSGWFGALAIIAIVAAIGVGGVWLLRRRRQQTQYTGLRENEMAMIRHDL